MTESRYPSESARLLTAKWETALAAAGPGFPVEFCRINWGPGACPQAMGNSNLHVCDMPTSHKGACVCKACGHVEYVGAENEE